MDIQNLSGLVTCSRNALPFYWKSFSEYPSRTCQAIICCPCPLLPHQSLPCLVLSSLPKRGAIRSPLSILLTTLNKTPPSNSSQECALDLCPTYCPSDNFSLFFFPPFLWKWRPKARQYSSWAAPAPAARAQPGNMSFLSHSPTMVEGCAHITDPAEGMGSFEPSPQPQRFMNRAYFHRHWFGQKISL